MEYACHAERSFIRSGMPRKGLFPIFAGGQPCFFAEALAEMARILKPGGRLMMIDMEAAEESLRETEDAIERLRDPSHVRNLSKEEMLALYEKQGLSVAGCETVWMPVNLENWMAHTETPAAVRDDIRVQMAADLAGRERTGFYPYRSGPDILFDHRWILIIGTKVD